jgi:hypothetical protein
VLKYRGVDAATYAEVENWEVPKFPVNGHDLMEQGCHKGKVMSVVMAKLRKIWMESDFAMEKEALVAAIPGVLDSVDDRTLAQAPKLSKKERKAQKMMLKRSPPRI